MNAKLFRYVLALAAAVSATLACKFLSRGAPSAPATSAPVEAAKAAPLFQDDFTDTTIWETENTSDDVIDYADGTLKIKIWSGEYFVWSNLLGKSFKDVHIEATVQDQSTDTAHSFGLVCGQQRSGGHATVAHYWFGLDPNGYYEIGKRVVGKDDVVLTGNGDWATSEAFPKNAHSYRLGADCGHGTLTFYVNGTQIASVQDATYAEGGVGLFLWSGQGSAGPVTFDDVVITALK